MGTQRVAESMMAQIWPAYGPLAAHMRFSAGSSWENTSLLIIHVFWSEVGSSLIHTNYDGKPPWRTGWDVDHGDPTDRTRIFSLFEKTRLSYFIRLVVAL